jgi:hypothetical protein
LFHERSITMFGNLLAYAPRGECARVALVGLALLATQGSPLRAAEPALDYPTSLRQLYGAYQGVLARRDACAAAHAGERRVYDRAFESWQARHRSLIQELEHRFALLIRGASKDEKDYVRNLGKYEGLVLRQREEVKHELLKRPPSELAAMCKALPAFLAGPDSDIASAYPEELALVRRRAL